MTRFGDNQVETGGIATLPVLIGEGESKKEIMLNFAIVDKMYAYNIMLGRDFLRASGAIVSMNHLMMKFPIAGTNLIGTVKGDQKVARECHLISAQGCEKEAINPITVGGDKVIYGDPHNGHAELRKSGHHYP